MSTLLIEGGRRLSGSIDVEGNKNAALPLLAACLLTTEECVLTNVPRISDVEGMARLLIDLGATVDGIGTSTLRIRCEQMTKDEPDAALSGGFAVRCCFWARCWRGAAERISLRPAAIFPRDGRSRRIWRRSSPWGRALKMVRDTSSTSPTA